MNRIALCFDKSGQLAQRIFVIALTIDLLFSSLPTFFGLIIGNFIYESHIVIWNNLLITIRQSDKYGYQQSLGEFGVYLFRVVIYNLFFVEFLLFRADIALFAMN